MKREEIADIVAAFFADVEQTTGLPTNRCQTGDEYQTFSVEGHDTAENALKALLDKIRDYIGGRPGILYWRRPVAVAADFTTESFAANARLVFTDKPALYPDVEALRSARLFGDPLLPRVNQ